MYNDGETFFKELKGKFTFSDGNETKIFHPRIYKRAFYTEDEKGQKTYTGEAQFRVCVSEWDACQTIKENTANTNYTNNNEPSLEAIVKTLQEIGQGHSSQFKGYVKAEFHLHNN